MTWTYEQPSTTGGYTTVTVLPGNPFKDCAPSAGAASGKHGALWRLARRAEIRAEQLRRGVSLEDLYSPALAAERATLMSSSVKRQAFLDGAASNSPRSRRAPTSPAPATLFSAAQAVTQAERALSMARQSLLDVLRGEVASGTRRPADAARMLGVSRQRVAQLLT